MTLISFISACMGAFLTGYLVRKVLRFLSRLLSGSFEGG